MTQQQPRDHRNRCGGKHRIIGQRPGPIHGELAARQQRETRQEHGRRHEDEGRHRRPGHPANRQVGRHERQGEHRQLSQRVPRVGPMRSDDHQCTHHAERNGHGPEPGLSKPDTADRLTQPVGFVHKTSRHGGVGRGDRSEQQEQREPIFKRQQRKRKHRPFVRQRMNTNPEVRDGDAETCQIT